MDISFSMQVTYLKFYGYLKNIAVEGTVSQIFYIGLSLFSINSRKNIQKKKKKLPVFGHKIKTRI